VACAGSPLIVLVVLLDCGGGDGLIEALDEAIEEDAVDVDVDVDKGVATTKPVSEATHTAHVNGGETPNSLRRAGQEQQFPVSTLSL
jgi:hypothetical protein